MSSHAHRTLRGFEWLCVVLAALAGFNTQIIHAAGQTSEIVISAVLPNPSGGAEWVVIENRIPGIGTKRYKTFLPWLPLSNNITKPIDKIGAPPTLRFIDIAGWQLGHDDVWYTLPHDLPPVPAGAKVMVYFDGLGASENDYDYSDGIAILHSPADMTNVLPDAKGVILLYAGDVNTPDNLRAKYEWGVGIE